jgi:hypothetical protein
VLFSGYVADGSYDVYREVGLALFERFGEVVHGLCWRSFHRHQAGRVYAIWHHRKDALGIVPPSPAPLADDPEWRDRLEHLRRSTGLTEVAS